MASIKTRRPKNARRYYINDDVGRTTEGKRIQSTKANARSCWTSSRAAPPTADTVVR